MSPTRSHPGSRTEIRLGVRAHHIHIRTGNRAHAPPDMPAPNLITAQLDAENRHR